MSHETQKADQIAFHFYTKLFYAINHARATEESQSSTKTDRWFNLETPDSDLFTKEAREPYRYVSQAAPPGPPSFGVQVLLAIPELTNNQVLVYMSPDSSRVRIEPTPAFVLLEQWTLQFTPIGAGQGAHANVHTDVALPIIYKHGIVLFRSIFSLLRILPAWKFFKRLKRSRNGNLAIRLRVKPLVNVADAGILGFGASPSPTHAQPLSTSSYTFPVIPHLSGTLALSATYLDTPNFQLDELESLLSSRFISLDLEGFVPTLDKNRQRDSVSGSSLPASKSSLSRSPPRPIGRVTSGAPAAPLDSTSIAEKFILPARVPAPASLGTSASTGSSALIPPPRPFPTTSAQPTPTSGLAITRIRKESLNSSSSSSISTREPPFQVPGTSSLSSSPASGPLPIRRPNINPVHPFKSNTLSSASGSSPSLSIRQGVPGAGVGGSPIGGVGVPSSLSGAGGGPAGGGHSRQGSSASPAPNVTRMPPSPIGSGFGAAPFAPSSLGDRRPGTSGSGASSDRDRRTSMNSIALGGLGVELEGGTGTGQGPAPVPMQRKRYSSSFGHRYVGSVSSSTGVPAPVGTGGTPDSGKASVSGRNTPASGGPEGRKEGVASYLSTTTDDDDISVFVQDIDSRKPLSGRVKERADKVREPSQGVSDQGHDRETTDTTVKPSKGKQRETIIDDVPLTTSPPADTSSVPLTEQVAAATALTSTSPTRGGPMLTSQGEVDERLSRMKETFLKSLEGLGGGSTRRKEKDKDKDKEREKEKEKSTPTRTSSSSNSNASTVRGVGLVTPYPSSFNPGPGMGLGIGRGRGASTSSSTLATSDVGASQGSEEVIGRMDLYEERKRGFQG